jgi:outer membrane protein assembly factor BamA
LLAPLVLLGIAMAPSRVWAVGEEITDLRVLGNTRTDEATVRSIAGVSIGDTLQIDTLDMVRERLNTTGLFADVNVWWEPHGAGVRVNIAVKDKFPWAPVPTASLAANNKSIGLLFVHGNLFGRGKQLLIGGRLATVDSGAAIAYRDPSFFGTWIYWQLQGVVQRQVLPEFDNSQSLADPVEIRETRLLSYGFEPSIGIAWFRRVKTQVAWHLEKFKFDQSDDPNNTSTILEPSMQGGLLGMGRASLIFDFRAREFAVMTGAALTAYLDYAGPSFQSDYKFQRAGVNWEHGIRFFRSHNLIYAAGAYAGRDLPFFAENTVGGPNSRGYLYQQFRGDTELSGKAEYHFPLFSIASLDFRALVFYDVAAVWFRNLPTTQITGQDGQQYLIRDTFDQRTFPLTTPSGFSFDSSIHNSVGGGLRFFLRSVAVPLIGFDAGYGIEAHNWRFILIVGA